jgi:hypothetical protein
MPAGAFSYFEQCRQTDIFVSGWRVWSQRVRETPPP